jgi:hypothetical protein
MSYWVYLEDRRGKAPWCDYGSQAADACPSPCYSAVQVPRFAEGGTHALGGRTEASLNITYNYGAFIRQHLHSEGVTWLDEKPAHETIKRLECAVRALGTERDPDYWKATPGNVGHALDILLGWARQYPQAVWRVS